VATGATGGNVTRVVMTGGGGFIGSHVLARLAATGADVTLVGATTGKSRYTASLVASGDVRFLRCADSFTEEDVLRRALADADALVLLGYRVPAATAPDHRLSEELALNVAPVIRLLRAADGRARHIVFASSVSVYGSPRSLPVDETTAPRPQTAYAISKLLCEEAIQLLCATAGSTATILRYSTVYGSGETVPRAIPNFIRAALASRPPVINGDGLDAHDYIHVANVAEATVAAVARRVPGVFNVGTGVATATMDLAHLIVRLVGSDVAPVHGIARGSERVRIACATAAAEAALGFRSSRTLEQGLPEEIGWFRSEANVAPQSAFAVA
jgi:UDP-glucose 4-epimerase